MQFYILDIIKYMSNICHLKLKDRRMKKYKCVEFTQSHCGSVGKILSKFNVFIFLRFLFIGICKPQNVQNMRQNMNCEILGNIRKCLTFSRIIIRFIISFLFNLLKCIIDLP